MRRRLIRLLKTLGILVCSMLAIILLVGCPHFASAFLTIYFDFVIPPLLIAIATFCQLIVLMALAYRFRFWLVRHGFTRLQSALFQLGLLGCFTYFFLIIEKGRIFDDYPTWPSTLPNRVIGFYGSVAEEIAWLYEAFIYVFG